MKKFISVLLSLGILFMFSGCFGKSVAFSEKLPDDMSCYLDVVEVIPRNEIGEEYDFYCECKLEDGSSVWMSISEDEFIKYFDKDATSENMATEAQKVTYENPVRLNGKANKIKDIEDTTSSQRITVFEFESADTSDTLEKGTRSSSAVEYNKDLKKNTAVYADVTFIEVKYTVSSSFSSYSSVSDVICECRTDSGNSAWLYISVDDYHEFFDEKAHFNNPNSAILSATPSVADTIEFVEPVKLVGLTVLYAEEISTLSGKEDVPEMVMKFVKADKEKIEAAKLTNQDPESYQGQKKINQPVYADITHITPEYALYSNSGYSFYPYNKTATDLVCKCKTANGQNIWIVIGIKLYSENFFTDYEQNMKVEKALQQQKKITGLIESADTVATDLQEKIGQDTVIEISEVTNV